MCSRRRFFADLVRELSIKTPVRQPETMRRPFPDADHCLESLFPDILASFAPLREPPRTCSAVLSTNLTNRLLTVVIEYYKTKSKKPKPGVRRRLGRFFTRGRVCLAVFRGVLPVEDVEMARPAAKELTERELEVMHVFWDRGQSTASDIRDQMAAAGRDLAYTTVATLVRILAEKGFLEQCTTERPFQYRPVRDFDEVSRSIVSDMIDRLFHGSREQLLVRLFGKRRLTAKERDVLESILREKKS